MKHMLFIVLFTCGLGACGGSVCEQAADIVEGCGISAPTTGDPAGEEPMCTGDLERSAKCAVDHEAEVCAYLKDGASNSYSMCIGANAGLE